MSGVHECTRSAVCYRLCCLRSAGVCPRGVFDYARPVRRYPTSEDSSLVKGLCHLLHHVCFCTTRSAGQSTTATTPVRLLLEIVLRNAFSRMANLSLSY